MKSSRIYAFSTPKSGSGRATSFVIWLCAGDDVKAISARRFDQLDLPPEAPGTPHMAPFLENATLSVILINKPIRLSFLVS